MLKIADLDGNETYRANHEKIVRLIEFEYQMHLVGDQQWAIVPEKKYGGKFIVYDIFQSTEKIEDEIETKNEI